MFHERQNNGWLMVEKPQEDSQFKVLLLPGLHGSDLVFKRLMKSKVTENTGIHFIAANPPGFKGLDVPAGFDFKVESFAYLYEQMAAAENIGMLIGHSFSANVLIEVAARGNFKGKLVLISPSLYRAAEIRDLLTLDSLSRKPLVSGVTWRLTYMMMDKVFKPYFNTKSELSEAVTAGRMIPFETARKTLMGYFDHLDENGNLTEKIRKTRIPLWYVRGSLDDIRFTEKDKTGIMQSKFVHYEEIHGARHFAMIDRPDDVARVILNAVSD